MPRQPTTDDDRFTADGDFCFDFCLVAEIFFYNVTEHVAFLYKSSFRSYNV